MRPARRRVRSRSTRILEPAGSVGSIDSPRTEITTQRVGSMPWPSSQSRRNQTGPLTGASSRSTAPPPAAAATSRVPTERAPGGTRFSFAAATGRASEPAKSDAGRARSSSGIGSPPASATRRASARTGPSRPKTGTAGGAAAAAPPHAETGGSDSAPALPAPAPSSSPSVREPPGELIESVSPSAAQISAARSTEGACRRVGSSIPRSVQGRSPWAVSKRRAPTPAAASASRTARRICSLGRVDSVMCTI